MAKLSIGAAALALCLGAAVAFAGDGELDGLRRDLGARHPKTRRGAVRALAELGTPDAWRLVAESLDDPESEVGDQAQLALAAVGDERVQAGLLGELGLGAKSERVRLRVAEALGRMRGPLDARALGRAFDSRDGESTRLVLWSVERLAARDALVGERLTLLSKVDQLARLAGDGGTRAAALTALFELDRERALRLCPSAADARDPEVRVAALALGARAPDDAARARLAAAVRDPSAAVRCQAIAALEAQADRAAVGALVALLEREPRLRVAERAVAALQRLSRLKHRRDVRPWRDWWTSLPEAWRPAPPESGAREVPAEATSAANFGGLSILSDRLSFLVDFSGSMWQPRDDGRSVKSVVDARLAIGLEGLSESARFNLVPYANEPLPWESELVDAKPANKRRALAAFVACRARGRGNFDSAVRAALADDEVDTLMIWSDGVPTGGLHSNLELVVPLLLEHDRFRNVAFDLILVDAPKSAVTRLGELARRSGGRALAVSLDDLAGATASERPRDSGVAPVRLVSGGTDE